VQGSVGVRQRLSDGNKICQAIPAGSMVVSHDLSGVLTVLPPNNSLLMHRGYRTEGSYKVNVQLPSP